MNVTRAAIEQNRVTTALLILLLVSGVITYMNMPRAEDPGFVVRTAVVMTFFPGASPERVELLVTDKIEKVVQEIPELDYVTSQSTTGTSIVWAEIQPRYKEMRPIWDDLRRKVEKVAPDLPEGIIGPIVNDEFGDVFGTIIALTGDGDDYSYTELKDVADDVRDELLRIDEVAKVEIYGAQEERVFVEYNNARLAEVGISPFQLQAILESRNIIIPGGAITTSAERIALEPSGNFESVDDLRRSVIHLPGSNDVIALQDIATVRRGYVDPPQTMTRASGIPALALAISLREGGNIISLGEQFVPVYERVKASYPIGIEFDLVAYQPDVVDKKINDFVRNLLQAIGVIILVILITLGIRTGLVVSTLIPMAILTSLLIMPLFNVGLHQMSLAALIIALGIMVDNAIVMSESIMVRLAEGRDRLEAVVESATELRIPLLTASLTTAAAFLPMYLAESTAGEYVGSIFIVITITLLSSWVLSLTMIPMFSFLFLKVKKAESADRYESGLPAIPTVARGGAQAPRAESCRNGGFVRPGDVHVWLRAEYLFPPVRPSDGSGRDQASRGNAHRAHPRGGDGGGALHPGFPHRDGGPPGRRYQLGHVRGRRRAQVHAPVQSRASQSRVRVHDDQPECAFGHPDDDLASGAVCAADAAGCDNEVRRPTPWPARELAHRGSDLRAEIRMCSSSSWIRSKRNWLASTAPETSRTTGDSARRSSW